MSSSKQPAKKPSGTPRRGSADRSRATRASGPPASARLTIKPGPTGPRTIELPPRPRPGGLRRLSEVILDEDELLTESFEATLDGVTVRVLAVLERTCVYVGKDGDRRLANKKDIWIEADKLPIRRRGIG